MNVTISNYRTDCTNKYLRTPTESHSVRCVRSVVKYCMNSVCDVIKIMNNNMIKLEGTCTIRVQDST